MKSVPLHLLLVLATGLLIGCATTHPGYESQVVKDDPSLNVHMSGRVLKKYSDKNNYFIEFTIENNSDHWLRVAETDFKYGRGTIAHNIPVGRDLKDWSSAMSYKLKMENHNQEMTFNALAGLGAASAVAGASSDNKALAAAGVGTMAAISVAESAQVISRKIDYAQDVRAVPEEHIYAPFSVPAGMFLRKWILVHVPGDKISSGVFVSLKTDDGKVEKHFVQIAGH